MLVSSDDNYLTMSGGVSESLRFSGGPQVTTDARKHIPLRLGNVAVTSAGELSSKYIFHGITIDRDELKKADAECIKNITEKSLEIAETLGLKSTSFPALGTGIAGFSYERASEAMMLVLVEFLSQRSRSVESVDLVIYPRREGQSHQSDLFYSKSVQLATQWMDTKKLRELIIAARRAAPAHNLDQMNKAINALCDEISRASSLFDFSTSNEGKEDEISSRLQPISEYALDATSTSLDYSHMPDEAPALLRLRMQSLRTQVNILVGNLNQREEKKAHYGPLSTPIEIENSISITNRKVEEEEAEIREITKRLS